MGETISTCVGTDRSGSYKEYVTDGDSDPYYREQGRSVGGRSPRADGGSGSNDGGGRRQRARRGAPDRPRPPGTRLDDLASSSSSSSARAADYGAVQSTLPPSSARMSTDRNSDDILHRADVARHQFRLALMHAGDAGEAAAVEGRGTTFPSSSSSASDAASGQQEIGIESDYVHAARTECLDRLRRLREEAGEETKTLLSFIIFFKGDGMYSRPTDRLGPKTIRL